MEIDLSDSWKNSGVADSNYNFYGYSVISFKNILLFFGGTYANSKTNDVYTMNSNEVWSKFGTLLNSRGNHRLVSEIRLFIFDF